MCIRDRYMLFRKLRSIEVDLSNQVQPKMLSDGVSFQSDVYRLEIRYREHAKLEPTKGGMLIDVTNILFSISKDLYVAMRLISDLAESACLSGLISKWLPLLTKKRGRITQNQHEGCISIFKDHQPFLRVLTRDRNFEVVREKNRSTANEVSKLEKIVIQELLHL
eukprot:TRINITY_DN14160_c0_g1_i2.p1 TRINITY_DN14160_c0_g1~~TRINITY_DN14160_c0_g1_i2.p1  ORF type:complete len:165 (-),score=18.41 TRINITY_DN14160_c0_g1_i2:55-549(-)